MSQVLDDALAALSRGLPIAESIVSILMPPAAPVASIAAKIAQGVIAGVPEAEALWTQFQSGDIPTQEQLDAYAASEQAAYDKLMADIKAKMQPSA